MKSDGILAEWLAEIGECVGFHEHSDCQYEGEDAQCNECILKWARKKAEESEEK